MTIHLREIETLGICTFDTAETSDPTVGTSDTEAGIGLHPVCIS